MSTTVARERSDGSGAKENTVSSPETLGTVVENNWLELGLMWRKAIQDRTVTPEEQFRLSQQLDRMEAPVLDMTTSWNAACSLFRGERGVYGHRFVRIVKTLWARPQRPVAVVPRDDRESLSTAAD